MNCFYHPQTVAVALCKSCSRGLCSACAVDVGNGTACRARCEEAVRSLNRMIEANARTFSAANTQLRRNMFFSLAAGLLFIAFGVFMMLGRGLVPGIIFVTLGAAFALRGIGSYTRAARYPSVETPINSDAPKQIRDA